MSNSAKTSKGKLAASSPSTAAERKPALSIIKDIQRQTLNTNIYYRWSKEFLEAGKKRLAGGIARDKKKHLTSLLSA